MNALPSPPLSSSSTFRFMLLIKSLGRLASTDARQQLITIHDSCLKRLKLILDKPKENHLRINVETGGCSGFSYVFEIENNNKLNSEEDLVFEKEDYKVVINKDILPFMKGSTIEYNESLIKSSFHVANPIAETKCGCGSSFSVDLNKLQRNNNN